VNFTFNFTNLKSVGSKWEGKPDSDRTVATAFTKIGRLSTSPRVEETLTNAIRLFAKTRGIH